MIRASVGSFGGGFPLGVAFGGRMGSSAGEEFNPSVGDLVWVRLNNGSWWPGRVMGLDELSEISPVPRRIGTPVMLLGRKNINIDWYNIPKSKRVKAFRCREYNHCIEKAKASTAVPKKKNVKHPRRDDAILLALELENAQLGKDQLDVYARSSSPGGSNATSSDQTSESDENYPSALELSQSGISFEEPNQINSPGVKFFHRRIGHNCSGSEDDGLEEGSRRMKGLEDLGMCLAANKVAGSTIIDFPAITIPSNMVKGCSSFLKRKRTQVARVQELLKRKKRCRQLTQVMESANMVSVPVLCNQLPCSSCPAHAGVSSSSLLNYGSVVTKKLLNSESKTNAHGNEIRHQFGLSVNIFGDGSTEVNGQRKVQENGASCPKESRKNESIDGLYDVPLAGEENHSIDLQRVAKSGLSVAQNGIVKGCQKSMTTNSTSLQPHWNLGDAVCVNSLAQRMKKGTSKWQSKRKRNSRPTNKGKSRSSRNNRSKVATDKTDSGFQAKDSGDLNLWFSSSLYSVELQLQATYCSNHVPYVSLSSRLNGKAIVGHPVTIEVLHDRYSDLPMRAIAPKRSNSKRSRYFLVKSRKRKRPGLVSKKMRKLSSFNTQKKGEIDDKSAVNGIKGSVMACIPVKVVFSRLNNDVIGSFIPSCRDPSQNCDIA